MKSWRVALSTALLLVCIGSACGGQQSPAAGAPSTTDQLVPASLRIEPLASWNDRVTKRTILEFIAQVTDANNNRYVAMAERIAVFDNDGTLWAEHPIAVAVSIGVAEGRARNTGVAE